jgi:hypothetical protein
MFYHHVYRVLSSFLLKTMKDSSSVALATLFFLQAVNTEHALSSALILMTIYLLQHQYQYLLPHHFLVTGQPVT